MKKFQEGKDINCHPERSEGSILNQILRLRLRMTKALSFPRKWESMPCHPERSEGSILNQILRLRLRMTMAAFLMTALLFGTVSCKKSAGLSGAGPSTGSTSSGSPAIGGSSANGSISGTVTGGLSPVGSSTVSLYQAGNNTPLATVTSSTTGTFNISAAGASGLVYLVVTGGNNNGSGSNSSIQMAALVGSSSSIPAAVSVNELTTAAFMTVANSFGILQDSSGTVTFKAPASSTITNNIATQYNNFVSSGQLNTNNSNLTTTSQGSLNTIANVLANCTEGGSSGCTTVMNTATNPSTSANASNMMDAVNNMLTTTSSSKIASLFSLAQSKQSTTGFSLGAQPSSLSAQLAATVKTFAVPGGSQGDAVDSSGNIWTYNGNGVVKLSSSGSVLASSSGPGLTGLCPVGMGIDNAGNIWINDNSCSATYPKHLLEFNSSAAFIQALPITASGCCAEGLALDQYSNVFQAGSGGGVNVFSSAGSLIATYGSAGVNPFFSAAIDASGNFWMDSTNVNTISEISSTGSAIATYTNVGTGGTRQFGLSFDQSGNLWVANSTQTSTGTTVTKLTSSGTTLGTFTVGTNPKSIAIDATGNVWVASAGSNTVVELNSSGLLLGTYPVTAVDVLPDQLAIDPSGNIWVGGASGSIDEIVGAAAGPQFFPYSGPQWPY